MLSRKIDEPAGGAICSSPQISSTQQLGRRSIVASLRLSRAGFPKAITGPVTKAIHLRATELKRIGASSLRSALCNSRLPIADSPLLEVPQYRSDLCDNATHCLT